MERRRGTAEIRAQINPSTKEGPAFQRIYDSDGTYADRQVGRIYYHAIHDHYHFDSWGLYQLWTKAGYDAWIASGKTSGGPIYTSPKTSSCATDEEFVAAIPTAAPQSQYPFTGCLPGSTNTIVEGLAAGWGDTYDYFRFEQWIDMGQNRLGDGQYVLRSVADPDSLLQESAAGDPSREEDNDSTTTFTVQAGSLLDGAAPSGTVVINDLAAETGSANVTVKALGRDDVSGVDQVRISNNGTTWSTRSYTGQDSTAMPIPWNLTDASYGGTTTTGTKTVYVQFRDRAGQWSSSAVDTITYNPCAGTGTASTYGSAVSIDGPVSYWRLGDSCTRAADEKGLNNGSYLNGPSLGAAGLVSADPGNKAVRFDGVNDAVQVPDSASLDVTNAFSIEAWLKPDSLPAAGSWASVVTKAEAYSLQFNGPRLEFTLIQNGARRRLQAPAGSVIAGTAYHVVATFDGTTQRLYLNGTQVGSAAASGAASVTATPLTFGSWDGSSEFFPGTIDEVALYDKVLGAGAVSGRWTRQQERRRPPSPRRRGSLRRPRRAPASTSPGRTTPTTKRTSSSTARPRAPSPRR